MIDQTTLEYYLHPKHIKSSIIDEIKSSFPNELNQSLVHIKDYINSTTNRHEKQSRLNALKHLPLYDILIDIIATVSMTAQLPIPLISIASMFHIADMDKVSSTKTVCELIAVIAQIPYFTISNDDSKQRYVKSNLKFEQIIHDRLNHACYLPPMVTKPKHIKNNFTSGYLTFNDCVILGFNENQHTQPLSLDVLNTLNSTQYTLDNFVLTNFEKSWHREVLTDDELSLLSPDEQAEYYLQAKTFATHQEQFKVMMSYLKDNIIYFTHKYDKRGRCYSQGYHFNPQGDSFEKACLNLTKQETVTGEL